MPSRAAALPLSVALAALLAGSLGGCRIDTDGTSLAKHSRDVAYRVNQPVKTLEATSVAGTVEVVGREGTGIAVTEHLRYDDEPPQTRHEVQGDTLVLDSTCPKRNAC